MSIKVGDTIPKAAINVIKDGIQATDTATFFAGKKVVLFAVPGAFTPTCSAKHLPGFIAHMDSFSKRGIEVACVSVNDGFVMAAWGKAPNAPEHLRSEERRVGKEWVSTCRSRWSAYPKKTKNTTH